MDQFNMRLIQMMRQIEKEVMIECGHAQGNDEKQPTKKLAQKRGKSLVQKVSQGEASEKEEDNETEILSRKRDIWKISLNLIINLIICIFRNLWHSLLSNCHLNFDP